MEFGRAPHLDGIGGCDMALEDGGFSAFVLVRGVDIILTTPRCRCIMYA